MMKNCCKKIFVILLLSLCISSSFFIIKTQASEIPQSAISEVDENPISEKGRLMKYDKETNTTTEVDMSEVLNTLNNRPKSNYISKDIVSIGESTNIINENYPQPLLTDNRVAVGSMINNFPYSAICRINYNGGNGTGVLVGPNLVLTAAHVVFDKNNNNAKFEYWIAQPKVAGNGSSNTHVGWTQVYYYENWMNNHNWEYDIAICVLGENLGSNPEYQYMHLQYLSDDLLKSLPAIRAVGYADDLQGSFHQYYSDGKVNSVSTYGFTTSCYTSHGMSGGPVINLETGLLLGVTQGADGLALNQRTARITLDMYNLIISLR